MKKNVSRLLNIAAAFAAPLLIGSAAQAATFTSLLAQGDHELSDDNREILLDRNENNVIDVGDSIRGFAKFNNLVAGLNDAETLGGTTPGAHNEITAVFQLLVTGKKQLPSGKLQFTFGPDPDFLLTTEGAAALLVDPTMAGKLMAIIYEDPNNNANWGHSASINTVESTATDGTPYWYLGFENAAEAAHFLPGPDGIPNTSDDVLVSDNGEGWIGEGADNLNITLNWRSLFGGSNIAINRVSTAGLGGSGSLTLIKNPGILNTEPLGNIVPSLAEFIGNASNVGPHDTSPFDLYSNTDLSFTVSVIPLPAAVWAGFGLMGLLGIRRMRKASRD